MTPTILHIDMDAFFVSVEEVLDPSLKGKAVIVGGSPEGRGVVAAASYEARRFGVHSAMPIARARKLCPHAIFLRGAHKRYSEFSARVFAILEHYSPLVEPMSLDEAYLDLTGCERLHGPAVATAQRMHDEIRDTVGINASIGIAANKLMAKVASEFAKPNGCFRVLPDQAARFLAPFPVGTLPGIGPKGVQQFRRLGVRTVRDLAALPLEFLEEVFGEWGAQLHDKARGISHSPVQPREESKSISRETTLEEDSTDPQYLESVLSYLLEKAAGQLRGEGLRARCVTLKLRYSDFKTVTRSRTLTVPACEDHILFATVVDLFRKLFTRRTRVRLIGVGLTSLTREALQQMDLFDTPARSAGRETLYAGIDRIRTKYGFRSILRATSHNEE
ncbi:DNA polymerase IV [Nitrospina gracilis 3/211]|uniref:DNA polymerase IV n=1 Tax=Nitrospina gracilis (strain 3/211) TaxID=1266370 RepID=M1Z9H3_NITG3|nr:MULTISPECIES: DNA polymerase IV [Nitrospina]MCF8722856.1 DNA polymerase-4 [Nitrospina sp. Nb-3]CCQ89816.1 DNA polymerase IV [Nitrospina gracilis 3/211]